MAELDSHAVGAETWFNITSSSKAGSAARDWTLIATARRAGLEEHGKLKGVVTHHPWQWGKTTAAPLPHWAVGS